jgi:hypothetical protein
MRARIWIAAWVLGAGCAGGDLATSSFGEGETDLFGTMGNDDDDTSAGPGSADASESESASASASADDTTTETTADPDTGSTTDTGEDCIEEICDGLDNDCDDDVDEGCSCSEGDAQSCYSGPDGTAGIGPCVEGMQICGSDGTWAPCEGAIEPGIETCNGIDDDCDDETDEGFDSDTCGEGICMVTVETCVNGTVIECEPLPADSSESCNGEDDDCDGDIDENCDCTDGDTQDCYAGPRGTQDVGLCHGGTMTCADGAWGDCVGDVVPAGEACDNLDNDCDSVTDENNPQGGGACNTGMAGVCAVGHQQCNGGALGCVADSTASAEVCDGLDNDCDTGTDEGNPGGGAMCNTGLVGACSAGTTTCSGGALSCNQNVAAGAEVCDSVDNDCDGTNNEGNPGGNQACVTGFPGVCSPGTTACSGGSIVCNQTVAASAETCDGLDNDCDNLSDEGNPGGGQGCFTGQLGVCAQGTTACSGGAVACNPNTPAGPEVCVNGLDEDCDGTADDGCPCAHGQCTQGVALQDGCSACVTAVCAFDPFCCTTSWDGICVGEVWSQCNSAACWAGCGHNLCVTGAALANNCDSTTSNCVATICASDPFCCANSWDAQCVGEVTSLCFIPC